MQDETYAPHCHGGASTVKSADTAIKASVLGILYCCAASNSVGTRRGHAHWLASPRSASTAAGPQQPPKSVDSSERSAQVPSADAL